MRSNYVTLFSMVVISLQFACILCDLSSQIVRASLGHGIFSLMCTHFSTWIWLIMCTHFSTWIWLIMCIVIFVYHYMLEKKSHNSIVKLIRSGYSYYLLLIVICDWKLLLFVKLTHHHYLRKITSHEITYFVIC